MPVIHLLPGEFLVTDQPRVLSTVLGSCVSACLFDPVQGVAGMNHFLLPVQNLPDDRPWGLDQGGRYGIQAMELVINALLKRGADKSRLQAKLFGGASLLPAGSRLKAVGETNALFVRQFLAGERIPVVAEDLGGTRGRVIHFHTDTFFVWRRYLKDPQAEAVIQTESAAWKTAMAATGGGEFVDFGTNSTPKP